MECLKCSIEKGSAELDRRASSRRPQPELLLHDTFICRLAREEVAAALPRRRDRQRETRSSRSRRN